MTIASRRRKYPSFLAGCLDGLSAPSDLLTGGRPLASVKLQTAGESVKAAWQDVGRSLDEILTYVNPDKPTLYDRFALSADPRRSPGEHESQIAILTERIADLVEYIETHAEDNRLRRKLPELVSKRRKLLDYVKQHDAPRYRALVTRLGIRS